MKLNTKTNILNVISDENVAKLMQYESFTFEKSAGLDDGSTDPDNGEALYHLGANHAFSNSLDFIETQDVTKKTAVDGRMLTVVVLSIGAVVLYGPVKRRIKKLVDKRLATPEFKAKAAKVHDKIKKSKPDVIIGEVIKPDNSAS